MKTFIGQINMKLVEIKTTLENMWQRRIQSSNFFQYTLLLIPKRKYLVGVARARPAVPLGLWSITSSLRGNLYVPGLHKFIKWFADNDVPHRN